MVVTCGACCDDGREYGPAPEARPEPVAADARSGASGNRDILHFEALRSRTTTPVEIENVPFSGRVDAAERL
jgi:hypothetical protein